MKKCKDDKFRIVTLPDEDTVPSLLTTTPPTTATPAQEAALNQVPAEASSSIEPGANVCQTEIKLKDRNVLIYFWSLLQVASSQGVTEWVPDEFHERLSVHMCDNIEEVERFYAANYHVLTGNYGVLKFMYTVLLTKV